MENVQKRLAYLSGAPRVSTRPEAGATGPRTHVVGVINAFRNLGWEVRTYIVGDRVPLAWVSGYSSEQALWGNQLKRVAADWVRLGIGIVHGIQAARELGRPDWAYERYGVFQALGWWFKQKNVPWILETNDLIHVTATSDRRAVRLAGLLRIQEKWAYQTCDVLVCVSQALADLIVQRMDIQPGKIVVLPNGVDVKHMDPIRANPVRFFDGPVIGFVGHLYEWQRLDLMLEAVARLSREGIRYNVVVVGDGPMRKNWEALAGSLGLSNQVRFTGHIPWERIPDYIAGFDLGYFGAVPLAVGSMYLSPLKLYEYAAMGLPIVAANYPDAQRLLEDGVAGYAFTPGDRDDLCRALRQAYREQEHWRRNATRTRSIVVDKHSWETRVRDLIKAVESILAEKYGTPYPARR